MNVSKIYEQEKSRLKQKIWNDAEPELEKILTKIIDISGVTRNAITGRSRSAAISTIRQYFCYRAKRDVVVSLVQVGAKIGRNHSNVVHSIKLVDTLLNYKNESDAKVRGMKQLHRLYDAI